MRLTYLFFAFVLPLYSLAQNDSSVIYINKEGKVTSRDSAFIYSIVTKNGNLWHGKTYFSKNNRLQAEGDFLDANLEKPIGIFNNYLEDGTLSTSCTYNNGDAVDRTYYYNNGNKKSYVSYNNKGVALQKGWNEDGKEIRDYITEQEARFNGGSQAWNKYIEKHLNIKAATDAGMPDGEYEVIVQFSINTDGSITNVKAISFTGDCKVCAQEAISVFTNAPSWQPAILNNEPVVYRQKQKVVFRVANAKKSKQ